MALKIKNNSFRINWLHLSVKNNNSDGEFKKLGVDRKNKFNSHNFISSFLTLGSWKSIILNYITILLNSITYLYNIYTKTI